MKRGARPFTVEVRRGQRRLPGDEPHEQQFDLVEEQPTASRDDALRRAEAALFGFREPEQPLVGNDSSVQPTTGRILKNLAEVDPVAATLAADAPRRRGRKPGSVNRPKSPEEKEKLRPAEDTAARHVPLTPDVVSAALKAIEKSAPVVIPRPAPAARAYHEAMAPEPASPKSRETFGTVRQRKIPRPPEHPVASRRADTVTRPGDAGLRIAHADARSGADSAAAAAAPAVASKAAATPGRRVSIMGRYVFGTELKPGEQWKRLLPWRR